MSDRDPSFFSQALDNFHFQYERNPVYKKYAELAGYRVKEIRHLEAFPFLPITLFKNRIVSCFSDESHAFTFRSSGTGGERSTHYVYDGARYQRSILEGFKQFYGDPSNYVFLCLLPSYLEKGDSSLVCMMQTLMDNAPDPDHGFYLDQYEELEKRAHLAASRGKKVFLIGVTYALLDMAERKPSLPAGTVIVETGGMKGRRKEMIRAEVHDALIKGMGIKPIHSEYGMTELLSQAWSAGNGVFHCSASMQVLIRDTEDPKSFLPDGRTGLILIVDLANRNSCSFIATEDLGRKLDGGGFEVLGRMDQADLRGCNLMIGDQDTIKM